MKVMQNELGTIIEPWSEPGQFSRVKHSVVDITGSLYLFVSRAEVMAWAGEANEHLLPEYVNNEATNLFRSEWPKFVTDISKWVVTGVERVPKHLGSDGFVGWVLSIEPAQFESSQDIELESSLEEE